MLTKDKKMSYSELWLLILELLISPSNTYTNSDDSLAGAKRVVKHAGWTWDEFVAERDKKSGK